MFHALLELGSVFLFAVRSECLSILSPLRWHIWAKRLRYARLRRRCIAAAIMLKFPQPLLHPNPAEFTTDARGLERLVSHPKQCAASFPLVTHINLGQPFMHLRP
jgi:hypothetical protein